MIIWGGGPGRRGDGQWWQRRGDRKQQLCRRHTHLLVGQHIGVVGGWPAQDSILCKPAARGQLGGCPEEVRQGVPEGRSQRLAAGLRAHAGALASWCQTLAEASAAPAAPPNQPCRQSLTQ